jgi:hypothetical protein
LKASASEFVPVRGLRYHVRRWGDPHAPKPVSVLQFDEKQSPHWLAYENASSRIVMANAGVNTES